MRKPHGLKVRRYAACMIDINDCLAVFPRVKASDKTFETELKGILLRIMQKTGSVRHVCRGLIVNSLLFKKM